MNQANLIKILIVDDDRRMVKTLEDILRLNGIEVETAYLATEALIKIEKQTFDCVIADIKMPGMGGIELVENMRSLKPELPVVLMTAYASNEIMEQAAQKGAIATLEKPLDIHLILAFFSSLRSNRTIVIIDDDPHFRAALAELLRLRRYKVIEILNPEALLTQPLPEAQIVLLDIKLDGINGLDILQVIREKQPDLPVILMTGYREELAAKIERALKIKATPILYKPFQIDELMRIIAQTRQKGLRQALSAGRTDT